MYFLGRRKGMLGEFHSIPKDIGDNYVDNQDKHAKRHISKKGRYAIGVSERGKGGFVLI